MSVRLLPTRTALARALLALVALGAIGLAVPAHAQVRYPRLGLGGEIHGNGVPYLDSLGTLDLDVIDAASRYDLLILDASPVTEYHPEILAALRARNPQLQALAYVTAENIWDVNATDSTLQYPTRYNHMIRDLGGFLYDRNGAKYPNYDINMALRDGNGNYVVAEAIAKLWFDAIVSTGLWDGMFVDVYCNTIDWTQAPGESIDVVRAGYPDIASFDVGWRAGTDTLAARLRALCGPAFLLTGNGALGTKYAWFNGWNRENFPNQEGGTWFTNMFWDTGGYFVDEQRFRRPTQNTLLSSPGTGNPFDANSARQVRFGLATASLGSGFSTFGPPDRAYLQPPYDTWWYDEYAVDLTSGRSATDRAHTGWLGAAQGPPYQMIWVGTNPDVVTNPGFETDVTTGWTFQASGQAQATLVRDTTTAAVGRASAHVSVTRAGAYSWSVGYQTGGALMVNANTQYAATFWARSVPPRSVTVALSPLNGAAVAMQQQALDGTWRQYQLVLTPSAPASAYLQFFVGDTLGDVWLDDVHGQQGITSLWRRDFDNGSVFVNPAPTVLTAPLAGTWHRILGTLDPVTNDGSTVTSATVNPSDGLFLIRAGGDTTPPAAIHDAHVTPQ